MNPHGQIQDLPYTNYRWEITSLLSFIFSTIESYLNFKNALPTNSLFFTKCWNSLLPEIHKAPVFSVFLCEICHSNSPCFPVHESFSVNSHQVKSPQTVRKWARINFIGCPFITSNRRSSVWQCVMPTTRLHCSNGSFHFSLAPIYTNCLTVIHSPWHKFNQTIQCCQSAILLVKFSHWVAPLFFLCVHAVQNWYKWRCAFWLHLHLMCGYVKWCRLVERVKLWLPLMRYTAVCT